MRGEQHAELDRFLAGAERRAFLIAQSATGNRDDALDIVQDSMLQLVRRYANRSSDEWAPLFHRILQNRIRDHWRRSGARSRVFGFFPRRNIDESVTPDQPWTERPDPAAIEPSEALVQRGATEQLLAALGRLPDRQRVAFTLRVWEGLNVADTAKAMGCGQGSVKTHLSRALTTLRSELGDHWP